MIPSTPLPEDITWMANDLIFTSAGEMENLQSTSTPIITTLVTATAGGSLPLSIQSTKYHRCKFNGEGSEMIW